MQDPELPVAAAIATVLVLIPVPTQLRVGNIPVLALLGGTFFVNVVHLVNTFVWAGNVRDVAPVWCDIATNIQLYFPLMGEGAALCICRQLEWIWSSSSAASTRPRRILFEISMCFIVPLISIPIRYSMSSSRYIILENLGCFSHFYPSILATVFTSGPELVVVLVGFVFGCLAIQNLIRRRQTSTSLLTTQSTLTTSRFVRLLTVCTIIGTWPVIAALLCFFPQTVNLLPWPGWTVVHANFSNIPMIPLFAQPPGLRQVFLMITWVNIITSYLVFFILICTEDARRDLGRAWLFVTRQASSSWRQCAVALARRPRALEPAPTSQWFDSSSDSGSNDNGLKMSVAAGAVTTTGGIVPGVKQSFTLSRHDRYPSAEGDLDTRRHLFPATAER